MRHLHAVRAHLGIESMHWVLDMMFGEDGCQNRPPNVLKNVLTLRKMGQVHKKKPLHAVALLTKCISLPKTL